MLHFNEQFRQLDEISDDSEKLPPTVKLTLLQTAVRSINDLRIVETLDEFQSTTHGHGSSTSLSFQTYCDILINTCVWYDKTKKANLGKRRNVYNTDIDTPYVDYHTAVIDYVPGSPHGGIESPPSGGDSTRSMPFPLGIHLLQGLATLPDHLSGPSLNNQNPQSPLKGMMALSTCHLKFINC